VHHPFGEMRNLRFIGMPFLLFFCNVKESCVVTSVRFSKFVLIFSIQKSLGTLVSRLEDDKLYRYAWLRVVYLPYSVCPLVLTHWA
jgi:hypothetical protein